MNEQNQHDPNDAAEADDAEKRIVYVRPIRRDQLPPNQAAPSGAVLYALHDEHGRPLALFSDRVQAMVAARAHDFTPVSAH